MIFDAIIEGILAREGGYTNNSADRGGETIYGITAAVARANGYKGPMRTLPRELAKDIYVNRYITQPGFAELMPISDRIADEVVDTGVNMGPAVATLFLQQALNGLNSNGQDYPDVVEDGECGAQTRSALTRFLFKRGREGEAVMLKALNCLQGARYISLARTRAANETFLYGWLRTRVML